LVKLCTDRAAETMKRTPDLKTGANGRLAGRVNREEGLLTRHGGSAFFVR
jgi:hypothetical protein